MRLYLPAGSGSVSVATPINRLPAIKRLQVFWSQAFYDITLITAFGQA
jgi:hypothetical protein